MNSGKNDTLGNFIRDRRESRGLTPHQAAARAGVDYSFWNKLENGHYEAPSPASLQRIAKALGVPIEDLYGLVGYDVPERLPSLTPYLRTKYHSLPPEAVADLERYFELLRAYYGLDDEEPVFPLAKAMKSRRKVGRPTGSQRNHPWRRVHPARRAA